MKSNGLPFAMLADFLPKAFRRPVTENEFEEIFNSMESENEVKISLKGCDKH